MTAVQIRQNEDVTWTLSTDYGDRHPSKYFGTPLINGQLDPATRFKNYNVSDSTIQYQDSWNQVKTEWQVSNGITLRNTLYYLNSQRHWRDEESYVYNARTGLIDSIIAVSGPAEVDKIEYRDADEDKERNSNE